MFTNWATQKNHSRRVSHAKHVGHLLLLLSYCAGRRLTLEYRSKYIHILNPTVREDIVHPLTAVTNCQICVRLKKAAERTKSRGCLFKVVDTRGPANFGIFVMRRRSASRLHVLHLRVVGGSVRLFFFPALNTAGCCTFVM